MQKKGVYIALLFAIIIGITFTLSSWARIADMNMQKEDRYKLAKETEWLYIKAVINENYGKAKLSTEFIKYKILEDIRKEYAGDLSRLQNDLDNPSADRPLYGIIQKNIAGVYINKQTDANDPLVFTKAGIIGDLSIDCSPNSSEVPFRSWDQEYAQTANKALSKAAIGAILLHAKYPIFWEYSKSKDVEHRQIPYMSISELEDIYYKEGLKGLATYEFISYSMIFEDKDIAERPASSGLGLANKDTNIIYIAQGFNLIDALEVTHVQYLLNTEARIKTIEHQTEHNIREELRMYIGLMVVLATCVCGILAAYIMREVRGG